MEINYQIMKTSAWVAVINRNNVAYLHVLQYGSLDCDMGVILNTFDYVELTNIVNEYTSIYNKRKSETLKSKKVMVVC